MKTDLIILAAGNSTRFQANKLLHLYQGKPLILHTFDKIDRSKFEHVIVVTQYSQIAEAARAYSFDVVINEHPDQGISSSIRLGLQACSSSECAMFLVADMPGLSAKTIDHMLAAAACDRIVAAYDEEIKNPILFPKKYWPEIRELQGDQGAKKIALRHLSSVTLIKTEGEELRDIDSPKDLYY